MPISKLPILRYTIAFSLAGLLSSCGVNSANLRRDETTRTYRQSFEDVFQAGLDIVREAGWTIENANKEIGFITAKSGMSMSTLAGQTISIQLRKLGEGGVEVFVTAHMNQAGIQMVGWGESSKFVRKVIAQFDTKLRPVKSPAEPQLTQ